MTTRTLIAHLIIALITIAMLAPYSGRAQTFSGKKEGTKTKRKKGNQGSSPTLKKRSIDWKKTRLEYSIGIGASNFLGELGGRDEAGSPYLADMEVTKTSFAFSGSVRYFLLYNQAVKGSLSYARVGGDDALTAFPNRRYRNLHFRSPIIELAAQYEFHFLRPKVKHFVASRATSLLDGQRFGLYATAGLGAFYFNPKSRYEGKWVALQPLGTEGQGLPDGPKKYSRIGISFPVGFGVSYMANSNLQIGLEYGLRLTRTDYIDDVSGSYYDNDVIRQEKGEVAAYLADPNINPDTQQWYVQGGVRGNPEKKDSYMFLQLTITSKLSKVHRQKKVKLKKGKKAVSLKNPKQHKVKKRKKGFRFGLPKLKKRRKRKTVAY